MTNNSSPRAVENDLFHWKIYIIFCSSHSTALLAHGFVPFQLLAGVDEHSLKPDGRAYIIQIVVRTWRKPTHTETQAQCQTQDPGIMKRQSAVISRTLPVQVIQRSAGSLLLNLTEPNLNLKLITEPN